MSNRDDREVLIYNEKGRLDIEAIQEELKKENISQTNSFYNEIVTVLYKYLPGYGERFIKSILLHYFSN